MYIYHLSHIDLDGYGCQYLSKNCFSTIECYNANYGPEVKARLEEAITAIKRQKFLNHDDSVEHIILITDLNLTTKEANWLEREAKEVGAKIQLLDHHGSGAKTAEQFIWYKLDTTKSATLITYEWLQKHHDFDKANSYATVVKAINAIDIWLSDDELFEFGKVGLGMISGAREINRVLFPAEDRALKLSLIDSMKNYVTKENAHIELDDSLHRLKKSFFKQEKNNTKDNLVALYVTKLLSSDKQRLIIEYRGYKGMLGYNLGNTSILGNTFLVENPDFDFYMDINFRGNFSLRSNNKLDVSKMAAEIGNGGGHPNASGGKIKEYKDSFVYSDIKAFVQDYIDEKTT
ncbi:phosphoesterase [Sulfurovum sp. bin170]|uniref:DHH family phosphoesterase n=1 Tax=Sulfurovum sp. bin170 TaxID=2695268 RepID=UPI0013DF3B91|nr:DHHA1 domain-containing protein [Sulfurovum sp. bin170]NEW61691.1 phosphoesterase [Sulfurovum sp. bin170]